MSEMAVDQGRDEAAAVAPQVLDLRGEVTPLPTLIADLWRRRGLIPMLAAKEFHSRYRSASFGVLWSVLLPLLQGAVLAVVFTHVIHIGIPGRDSYPVFVITGTVLWSYFSSTMAVGATTIVDQGGIASKVYFPRLILPAVPAAANSVGLAISMVVALGLMPLFGVRFRPELLLIPAAMALTVALVIGLSALCSVAHVYFRDVRYIVQAVLMVAFYATPVIYPLDRPSGLLRAVITANPMTGPTQLTHFAVFGHAPSLAPALWSSAAGLALVVVVTLIAFRRYERVACDRL
jgi:lipopolysaccharide transport system permease protein